MSWGGGRGRHLGDRLAAAQAESTGLRELLRELTETRKLINRYHQALLLVPEELWLDICDAAGVDPQATPGDGPDSAVGEAAAGPAVAGGAPPEERSA